jgi:hypothetical protein
MAKRIIRNGGGATSASFNAPTTTRTKPAGKVPPAVVKSPRSPKPRRLAAKAQPLRIKAVLHEAEEGGFWAEVPALPGCVTQGETMKELLANLREAVQGSLCVFPGDYKQEDGGWVQEVDI